MTAADQKLTMVATVATVVAAMIVAAAATSCNPGLDTPGYTEPRGDIPLEYGRQALQIDCFLNASHRLANGLDSSALRFFRGADPIEPAFLVVVNSSTLRLRVEMPPMSHSVYHCKLLVNDTLESVCLNNVFVGTQPHDVQDFECVSDNWLNLTCTWRPPHNYVKTHYSLTYKFSGRSARNQLYNCPKLQESDDLVYSCFWDLTTVPHYRQSMNEYLFTLNGTNIFGSNLQNFTFDHFANLKPAPPQNLTYSNRTPNGADIVWTIPSNLYNLPLKLDHRLMYVSERDPEHWEVHALSTPASVSNVQYYLTNLTYANTWYNVRVSMKSARATKPSMWSNYTAVFFKTLSQLPARPPDVDIGCFETVAHLDHRTVYAYWRQIELHEENGDDFTYQITGLRNNIIIKPNFSNVVYAYFERFPIETVELTIKSKNINGTSKLSTKLIIPSKDAVLKEPTSFTKIAFENNTFELSWRRVNDPAIESYTIFWCASSRDRPFQCDGRMDWMRVPPNTSMRNITMKDDKIYQFAISANSRSSSSGMVWASCTVIPGKVVDKMRSVWVNRVGDTFIEIGWKLDCSDRIGIIKGYRVQYCPIISAYNTACRQPTRNMTINGDTSQIHSNITDLIPYTTYAISVSVITRQGEGNPSDPLYNTTSEGAPTPPLDITVLDTKNDSITLNWKQPRLLNGILKYYTIYYGNYTYKVDGTKNTAILKGLLSYTNYTISVDACTVFCSIPSESVTLRTEIGVPGYVGEPYIEEFNQSEKIRLIWSPPSHPGGLLDLYEIKIEETTNDHQNSVHRFNTTETTFNIPFQVCSNPGVLIYHFHVRAINYVYTLDKNDSTPKITQKYKGPWSFEKHHVCYANQGNLTMKIVFGVIALIAISIGLFYGIKWLYERFKFMKNIKASMPPGLEANIKETKPHIGKWTNQKQKQGKDVDKSNLPPSADAVSLLSSKGPNLDLFNRMRSNCSVNTDVTALSLTSSNRASDDSGDATLTRDNVESESYSPNCSLKMKNMSSGSRPASAASTDKWNLPQSKPESMQEERTGTVPYSAVGTWPDDTFKQNDPLPTAGQGYVTIGNIPNCSPARIDTPLINITPGNPVVESPPYLFNGIKNNGVTPVEPLKPKGTKGYVSITDPMVTGEKPVLLNSANETASLDSYTDSANLFPNLDVNFTPKTSDYVKQGDVVIVNGKDANYLQKVPQIPKQVNSLSVNLPQEHVNGTQALSPEAYCRFGPNTNVPHRFDFQQSDEEADGEFVNTIKDIEPPEMLYFDNPPHSDRLIQSHYVPFKH